MKRRTFLKMAVVLGSGLAAGCNPFSEEGRIEQEVKTEPAVAKVDKPIFKRIGLDDIRAYEPDQEAIRLFHKLADTQLNSIDQVIRDSIGINKAVHFKGPINCSDFCNNLLVDSSRYSGKVSEISIDSVESNLFKSKVDGSYLLRGENPSMSALGNCMAWQHHGNIYFADLSGAYRIDNVGGSNPVVSPEGGAIVFANYGGGISIADIKKGKIKTMKNNDYPLIYPDCSFNADRIVFSVDKPGADVLCLYDHKTDIVYELWTTCFAPIISADGNKILEGNQNNKCFSFDHSIIMATEFGENSFEKPLYTTSYGSKPTIVNSGEKVFLVEYSNSFKEYFKLKLLDTKTRNDRFVTTAYDYSSTIDGRMVLIDKGTSGGYRMNLGFVDKR